MNQVYLVVTEKNTFSTLEAANYAAQAEGVPYTIVSRPEATTELDKDIHMIVSRPEATTELDKDTHMIVSAPQDAEISVQDTSKSSYVTGQIESRTLTEKRLLVAVQDSYWRTVHDLVNINNVDITDEYGNSLLHIAANNGDVYITQTLIRARATVNGRDGCNHTPLHVAAQYAHPSVIAALITAGADIEARDNEGNTPFLLLGQKYVGNSPSCIIECFDRLIKAGVNIHATNNNGRNALHQMFVFTYYMKSDLVCHFLLEAGVNPMTRATVRMDGSGGGFFTVQQYAKNDYWPLMVVERVQEYVATRRINTCIELIKAEMATYQLDSYWRITHFEVEFEKDTSVSKSRIDIDDHRTLLHDAVKQMVMHVNSFPHDFRMVAVGIRRSGNDYANRQLHLNRGKFY